LLKKFCGKQGCWKLTQGRYCAEHEQVVQQNDKGRGTAAERGYDHKWRKAREAFLYKHPLCVHCDRVGQIEAATVVDHIVPHRGNKALFWDQTNWQPLCKRHHDIKTAREDGGFGN
jgi:5-methylcytosine-specific restriction enzyme A